MKFLKKNKLWICIGIVLILFLILLVFFVKALLPIGKSSWGNRLEGIEEHVIANEDIEKIKDALKGTGKVSEVSYNSTGRTLKFIVYVNDDVSKSEAQSLVSNVSNNISADNLSYYDIQVMFDKKVENSDFPYFAAKHKTSKSFSFSK